MLSIPDTQTESHYQSGLETQPLPKLTRNQQKIFSKLKSCGRAVGAYELLDMLRLEGVNAIPTIYRALNGLMEKGIVRHITTTKTYIALSELYDERYPKVFLVCSHCNYVSTLEANVTLNTLEHNAEQLDFKVHTKHLELLGICNSCKTSNQH